MSKKCRIMNNLLIVKNTNEKWGAFNKELEIVLPFEYDSIHSKIKDGREIFFKVTKNGIYGFVPAQNVSEFIPKSDIWQESLAACLIKRKNRKFGIIDIRGDFIILPIYDKIEPIELSESYNYYDMGQEEKMLSDRFLLYKEGKVGLADYSKVLCAPVFDKIYAETDTFRDRLEHVFRVEKDGLFGYINAQGKVLCDIKYEEINYPCTSILTYAICGNTIDIINLEKAKVIYSLDKEAKEDINFEYKHCCITNKRKNCVYVLDSDGNLVTKFEIPKEILDYKICYINRKFLGYQKPIAKKYHGAFGLLDHTGEILSLPKYSTITPIKGTFTVVAQNLFSKECEFIDENCNVIMNNFTSFGSMEYDDEFGLIPPIFYSEFNSENPTMYFTDKNLNPDKRAVFASQNGPKLADFALKKEEGLFALKYEFEENGKRYHYHIPKKENKILVLNEDESLYKSIDFEVSEKEDTDFYDFW